LGHRRCLSSMFYVRLDVNAKVLLQDVYKGST